MRGAIRDALGDTAGATEDFCASLHLQPSLHQKDIATREKDQVCVWRGSTLTHTYLVLLASRCVSVCDKHTTNLLTAP